MAFLRCFGKVHAEKWIIPPLVGIKTAVNSNQAGLRLRNAEHATVASKNIIFRPEFTWRALLVFESASRWDRFYLADWLIDREFLVLIR